MRKEVLAALDRMTEAMFKNHPKGKAKTTRKGSSSPKRKAK